VGKFKNTINMPINGTTVFAPRSSQHSLSKFGGFYYNHIVWNVVKQFLGIGDYYQFKWRKGAIYIPVKKLGNSITPVSSHSSIDWDRNKKIMFHKLIDFTDKKLWFQPVACICDDMVENGEKLFGIHENMRFSDGNELCRNPVGEKIKLQNETVIPKGWSLHYLRNYYYKKCTNETDRQYQNRKKKGIFWNKKNKKLIKIYKYGKSHLQQMTYLKK
tara:strand:- start:4656 stop:5303 length:648 start_codon:yes stop_codon:yes gene_type:complete